MGEERADPADATRRADASSASGTAGVAEAQPSVRPPGPTSAVEPAGPTTDDHADLHFPGEAPPPPVDPREADREAVRIAEVIAQNRVAVARAVVVGFLVATAVFFGIAYAFPAADRGFALLAVALGAGAFAGVAVWAVSRSTKPVFDPGVLPPDAPVDAETRHYEERGRAHDRANQRALAIGAGTFAVAGPGVLYAWTQHLNALNETRGYFGRESIGTGRSLLVLGIAVVLGAVVTRVLRPRVDVLAELGGVAHDRGPESHGHAPALTKADVAELRAIARDVRAGQRRDALSHGGAVVGFLVTAPLVLFALDSLGRTGDRHGESSGAGGGSFLIACLAGAAVAYGISRAFGHAAPVTLGEAVARPDRGRDWFTDTLARTTAVTLEVPGDLESMLARLTGVATNRWTLIDADGAALADASEDELPLWRRFFPLRPRAITVRDLDRTPLTLCRPSALFTDDWRVATGATPAGTIGKSLFGTLLVRDASGVERYRVRRSWLDRRSRVVLSAGKEVARMSWPRPGFFATVLDRPGLVIALPQDAPLADRRLLLAAGLVLDLDRA